jgi:ankyrin repeat protein
MGVVGNTALLRAARCGHGNVDGLLLSMCAASSSYRGPNGMTALCVAAVLDRIDIVRDVVEATPTDSRRSHSIGPRCALRTVWRRHCWTVAM